MLEIHAISTNAYKYLMDQDPTTYAMAYFSGYSYCDVIKNNMYETFNRMILKAREKPLISMLE